MAEFCRAAPSTLKRHLESLAQYRDRIYVSAAAGISMRRESTDLTRTTQGHRIDRLATIHLRDKLRDPDALALLLTDPAAQDRVKNERYDDHDGNAAFVSIIKEITEAMKLDPERVQGERLLRDEYLVSAIKQTRRAMLVYLVQAGQDKVRARKFASGDSMMFRFLSTHFCRHMDWAQTKGIIDVQEADIYNEKMDLEYVTMASYFDEFLAVDKRNQRSDLNLRRLLVLAKKVRALAPTDEVLAFRQDTPT